MTIFILSTAFILYVLAGYPLWIAFWSRWRPQPVVKAFAPRSVSILLPVHNGERWLAEKLRAIRQLSYPRDLVEIIIISNASTDNTVAVARQHAGPDVQIIELSQPGKARALNAGLKAARGEILFLTDVRQWLEPQSLHALISNFADPRVGAVSGELVIAEGDSHEETNVGLYWKYEKLIRAAQSRIDSIPGATGSIYAMRRKLAQPLPENTLLDDIYLPLCAYFQGFRLTWEPGAKAFDYPASLDVEFARKVRTLAGVYQIIGRFPRLLVPNHRLWIHFVSHKLGRLLLPFALVAVLVSSFFLPSPLNYLVLIAQAVVYGLAALDRILSNSSPLKRLTSLVGTFVALMIATACATSILFVPADQLWKKTR